MKKLAAQDFEDLLQVSSGDDDTRLSLYKPFFTVYHSGNRRALTQKT